MTLHSKKPKDARAAWRSPNVCPYAHQVRELIAIARWHRAASRQRIKR